MGTTAQKLQRVLDTKEGLKDTINTYLGQDITSAIPFKDYETYIKNFYNNLPKTSYAEGSNITLSNTLKGKLDFEDGIVGIGDTKQDTTTGKNKLNPRNSNISVNGISFSFDNANQILTLNGTCTADNTAIDLNLNAISFTANQTKSITYWVSGSVEGYCKIRHYDANYSSALIYDIDTIGSSNNKISATSQATFNCPIGMTSIRFNNGSKANNLKIKLMVTDNSDTSYEPYTGGIPSPNPSYPQEIEVVRGTQTVYIKDENNNIIDTKTINLGEYEFAKIGNYVDTIEYDIENDKVYKNEYIGKYTFTGNENMAYDSGSVRFVINDLVNNLEVSGRQQIYSNRYKFIASGSADYGMFAFYNIVHQIFIYNKDYTNPSDLLSYFANNNTYFYYIRNNLNKTEITTTLKDQIKALYYSHSFTGTTIIEIDGDLPLIIKVRALKGE